MIKGAHKPLSPQKERLKQLMDENPILARLLDLDEYDLKDTWLEKIDNFLERLICKFQKEIKHDGLDRKN